MCAMKFESWDEGRESATEDHLSLAYTLLPGWSLKSATSCTCAGFMSPGFTKAPESMWGLVGLKKLIKV